jgi:hypothetical protein
MVYLVLEPWAAVETIDLAAKEGCSVWVGSDAITPEDFKELSVGARVTRFSHPLAKAAPEVVADALRVIEEHHPGEIIWVQHGQPSPSTEAPRSRGGKIGSGPPS